MDVQEKNDTVADVQEKNDKEQVAEGSCKAQVCSYKGSCSRCVNDASVSCKVWILLRQAWCGSKGPSSKEGAMMMMLQWDCIIPRH